MECILVVYKAIFKALDKAIQLLIIAKRKYKNAFLRITILTDEGANEDGF
jgi:hypothetical protein